MSEQDIRQKASVKPVNEPTASRARVDLLHNMLRFYREKRSEVSIATARFLKKSDGIEELNECEF